MADEEEVPEGAAVLPEIPAELNVHPLLLAVLHAVVFLAGSEEHVVQPAAAQEALDHLAGYLQRLRGPELDRVRADLEVLRAFARENQWDPDEAEFFDSFLEEFGVGEE